MKNIIFFSRENIIKIGKIDNYIYGCEVQGPVRKSHSNPHTPKFYTAIIILKGTFKAIINGKEQFYEKNTYINIPDKTDITYIEFSNDFHGMLVAISPSIVDDIFRNRNPFPYTFRIKINVFQGSLQLSRKNTAVLRKDINQLIESLRNTSHNYAKEINYAYFYILLTDLADIIWGKEGKGEPDRTTDMSHKAIIMRDLMILLSKNVEKETSIDFYADALFISKQYLSLVVKQSTKLTIGRLIANIRAERASQLLRDPRLSIQQISDKLSFPDQTTFGKFFKKHIGTSPLKYRSSLKKTLLSLRPEEILDGVDKFYKS